MGKVRLAKGGLLTALIMLLSLCLAFGTYSLFPSADGASAGDGAAMTPADTFYLGGSASDDRHYTFMPLGWEEAVKRAEELTFEGAENNLVKVVLERDWLADGDEVTSFGSATGFSNGRIHVPAGANMLLDLGGNALDRRMSEAGVGGEVIYVQGTLAITDSAPDSEHLDADGEPIYLYGQEEAPTAVTGGVVTGGYNTLWGGGIYVADEGKLTVYAGTISGNKAQTGGAIYSEGSLTVVNGAAVANSANDNGGGIYVASGSAQIAGEFSVLYNSAQNGAGIFVANGARLSVSDGAEISYNEASSRGGGIFVADEGEAVVNGSAEISYNTAYDGGGVFGGGALTASGNAVVTANRATRAGGGIAVSGDVTLSGNVRVGENSCPQNGGGIYVDAGKKLTLGGAAKVVGNAKSVDQPSNIYIASRAKIVGELTDGTSAGITLADGYTDGFTQGYSDNFASAGFARNPSAYFTSDDGDKYVVLGDSGEAVIGDTAVEWKVNDETVTDYGVSFVYGEDEVTSVKLNGTELLTGNLTDVAYESGKVGAHEIAGTAGSVSVKFRVYITPAPISASDITLGTRSYVYSGRANEPEVTVTVGGALLTPETDYTVKYASNINVGTALVTVSGKGNYGGEAVKEFTVTRDNTKIYMPIQWQYLTESGWTDNAPAFTFNGEDQSGKVRAKLEVNDVSTEYVYAQGYGDDEPAANFNMKLTFEGGQSGKFLEAAEYTVTLTGTEYANVSFGTGYDYDTVLTMGRAALGINSDTFAGTDKYEDADGNRLWLIYLGDNDGAQYVRSGELAARLDGAGTVYYDPDAQSDRFGNTVTVGDLTDSYARFRDGDVKLLLNGEYGLGEAKLGDYLEHATVTYTGNVTRGAKNEITSVSTVATVKFDSNFTVEGSTDNSLRIVKQWYVVTASNGILGSDGSQIPVDGPSDWTFGNSPLASAYRPEHGDYAVFTVKNGDELVGQFAVAFVPDGDGGVAEVAYGVKSSGMETVIDPDNVLTQENYFAYFFDGLGEGEYTLEIYVPEHRAEAGHTHWWSDSEPAEDDGVVYGAVKREYTFGVSAYSLTNVEGTDFNDLIEYSLVTSAVTYNGSEDNTPEVRLVFDGRVLCEGVDYELYSPDSGVGAASLVIKGIGGISGALTLPAEFTILRATNSWQSVPNISRWSYGSFDKDIHTVTASPLFLDNEEDMWFAVTTDVQGTQHVNGLEKFSLKDGRVPDSVADVLASLERGTYYLIARVEGTKNYSALAPTGIEFEVFTGENSWIVTPSITSWVVGKFKADTNSVIGEARFGSVKYVIVSAENENKVIYDSAAGIDKLSSAKAGLYKLTASVEGSENYSSLPDYTITFRVFQKAGMPWWGTLLIVLGVLLVLVVIFLILQHKGILQMLSGKMILAIRTRASIDATIAAVRANKVKSQAVVSVEKAKARDRLEARRAAIEQSREMTDDEQAASLEEKARIAEERAEALKASAKSMKERARTIKENSNTEQTENTDKE